MDRFFSPVLCYLEVGLILTEARVATEERAGLNAGWVSILLALKAAVEYRPSFASTTQIAVVILVLLLIGEIAASASAASPDCDDQGNCI